MNASQNGNSRNGLSTLSSNHHQQQHQHQQQQQQAATSNQPPSSSSSRAEYEADVLRIIGQHLVDLGLSRTVKSLLEESGLDRFEHQLASGFKQHVLAGDWDQAEQLVEELASYSRGDKKANAQSMRFLLAEQKFLELLEDEQRLRALKCLRCEVTPKAADVKQVQQLAHLLMYQSGEEVRSKANWPGKSLQSRQQLLDKLQKFVPPPIMLPSRRLHTLLSQATQLQRERCNLHLQKSSAANAGSQDQYLDLKLDHKCASDRFPLSCKQELDSHKTEVWFCKFSNDGLKLATGGLGGKVKIWDLDPVQQKLSERCTLDCTCPAISCLSWCPNDVYLLACGSDERSDLWIWNVNKEEVHTMINHSDDESTTTCSWHPSGEKFAAASIRGNFNIYDLDGNRRGSREGVRVQCLSFLHKDPTVILAADILHRIKAYAIKNMSLESYEEDVLEEKHAIMSFIVDQDDRFIAVNLMEQGIHLWDYKLRTILIMFPGVSQRNFTVHSSFSSPDSTFLASGSEDGKVYIYNIHREQPVAVLHGHSRCVNCVSWNPKFPELLASASDDRIVRLWAPDKTDSIEETSIV